MTISIPQKIARGATWMLLFKLFDRGLGFVNTIVLARILVPADFGLVAMAMSVIALIELASAFSFETALIQRKDPTRDHYDTTWTLRLLFGVLCAASTAAMALPTASFYSDPRLGLVMFLLAAGWLVESVENVGTVNFRRSMDFRREFVFLLLKRVVAVAVTLAIAVAYETYWALVAGMLVGRVMGVVLSYAMHPFRPRLSLAVWRDVMGFSGWLFVTNLLWFINSRLSHFVIGRTQGAEPLGLFTVANDVAALASTEITMPINRAVLPGLSRMAEKDHALSAGLLQVTAAVSLIALPASFGLAAIAEPMVLTLLGAKWVAAVPTVQILAFAGALQSLTTSNHSAYLACGKSHVPAVTNTAFACVLIPLLVLFHQWGVAGIAGAQLGATGAAVCVSLALMRRHLGVPLRSLLRVIARPLAAAAVMGAAVYGLDTVRFGLGVELNAVARLMLGVSSGAVMFIAMVGALWIAAGRPDSAEKLILERVRRALA